MADTQLAALNALQVIVERPTKYNPVPVETRQAIIQDALERIGHEGLREIAASHAISTRTLNVWLLAHPEYSERCQAITDARLIDAKEQFEKDREAMLGATDPFTLAQARDCHQVSKSEMAYAVMMAERRDKRYSPKAEVTAPVQASSSLSADRISELLGIMQAGIKAKAEKVIEHE